MRGNTLSAEPVGLEPDHLVLGAAFENDALPCIHRPLAAGVGCDRSVKQVADAFFVELSIRSMQSSVARTHNLGFAGFRLLVQRPCQSKTALCAQDHCSRGCGLQKFAAAL